MIQILGFKYIFGGRTHGDPFHFDIIRTQLTKNLARVFPDVFDEIDTTFKEVLPANEDGWYSGSFRTYPPTEAEWRLTEWVPVHVIKVARNVVARASNRVFVGLPMCQCFSLSLSQNVADAGVYSSQPCVPQLARQSDSGRDEDPELPCAIPFVLEADGSEDEGRDGSSNPRRRAASTSHDRRPNVTHGEVWR